MALVENLQKYTYEYLLQTALSKVSDKVDKREGSIIYDAIAPCCYLLAEYFALNYRLTQEAFIESASGEWLDKKVVEAGLTRYQATPATKKAIFKKADGTPATVPIGSRFVTSSTDESFYYVITEVNKDADGNTVPGEYVATCETAGTKGQEYEGTIIPLDFIRDVATAELGETISTGRDIETDDDLRERYLSKVNYRPFAGNIAHYREMTMAIDGVGGVQVYPTWNGAGTVKLSIVDSFLNPVTESFINQVQDTIDPDVRGAAGLGNAPIGHRVTIVTPEVLTVNISAAISLKSGYTLEQARPQIETALENYFESLRQQWDTGSDLNEYALTIYWSNIVAAMVSAAGVASVSATDLKINGVNNDLVLQEDGTKQQIPILGEVTLSVAT